MFVQYSFVQERELPATKAVPVEFSPSAIVGMGIASMLLTMCAFLWS